MFTLKNEPLALRLCRHDGGCVCVSRFWTEEINGRGWASCDMSFRTPMLSRCSIFIHLPGPWQALGSTHCVPTCQPSSGRDIYVRCGETLWSHLPVALSLSSPPNWMRFVTTHVLFLLWHPCLAWLSTSESAMNRVYFSHPCVVNDDKPSL